MAATSSPRGDIADGAVPEKPGRPVPCLGVDPHHPGFQCTASARRNTTQKSCEDLQALVLSGFVGTIKVDIHKFSTGRA
jgi:hypothetical protein